MLEGELDLSLRTVSLEPLRTCVYEKKHNCLFATETLETAKHLSRKVNMRQTHETKPH